MRLVRRSPVMLVEPSGRDAFADIQRSASPLSKFFKSVPAPVASTVLNVLVRHCRPSVALALFRLVRIGRGSHPLLLIAVRVPRLRSFFGFPPPSPFSRSPKPGVLRLLLLLMAVVLMTMPLSSLCSRYFQRRHSRRRQVPAAGVAGFVIPFAPTQQIAAGIAGSYLLSILGAEGRRRLVLPREQAALVEVAALLEDDFTKVSAEDVRRVVAKYGVPEKETGFMLAEM